MHSHSEHAISSGSMAKPNTRISLLQRTGGNTCMNASGFSENRRLFFLYVVRRENPLVARHHASDERRWRGRFVKPVGAVGKHAGFHQPNPVFGRG